MKLFLTSAGLPPETTLDFLNLLNKKPEKTRVCFIATASDLEKDKKYVEKDKERLSELGFKVTELDLKQENEKSLNNKLGKFDVIFVEGGNTFYLLKCVRESGFDEAIRLFLDKGGIYVGVSAGSIIAGLNIESAGWKHADRNIVKLKNLVGLKLVPLVISPHTDDSNIDAIEKCAKRASYTTVALTDKQAILVKNKAWQIVGPGEKIIFNLRD